MSKRKKSGTRIKRRKWLTNEQRLKRQGRIFNHDGQCGKIVIR